MSFYFVLLDFFVEKALASDVIFVRIFGNIFVCQTTQTEQNWEFRKMYWVPWKSYLLLSVFIF